RTTLVLQDAAEDDEPPGRGHAAARAGRHARDSRKRRPAVPEGLGRPDRRNDSPGTARGGSGNGTRSHDDQRARGGRPDRPPRGRTTMNETLRKLGVWTLDYADAGIVHVRSVLRWRVPEEFAVGEPGKPTIVLIPGVYERWAFLRPVAERLNAAGYPVSVVHGLGYNRRPVVDTSERLALALWRVAANLAGRLIVAHSKGGLVGKHLLVTEADRLHLRGLVAICTPFAGSRYARYVLGQTLRAFSPSNETIVSLGSNSSVNSCIVS